MKVPQDTDVSILGPLACGIGTARGRCWTRCGFAGSSVVVYGSGAVGLSAIMAARLTGATHIIAVDKLASRLSLATELGATETIDVSAPGANPVAAVQEICGGPADFSMDAAGNVNVLRQAANSVGMRGTVALIGGTPAGTSSRSTTCPPCGEKIAVGILGGEGRSASLIPTLITLNAQGRLGRLVREDSLRKSTRRWAWARPAMWSSRLKCRGGRAGAN